MYEIESAAVRAGIVFLYDVKKELKDDLEVKDVNEVEYKEI